MISQENAVEYKTETVPLTLEIAKHYSRMATLKGDRDPDTGKGKNRVAWLYEALISGMFHSPIWSTVQIGSEKGKKYRVDGGHSSVMLTQAGSYFPENMSVTIRHFRAPDIDTAIHLYEQFNRKHSTRTTTDLIKNRAAYVDLLDDINPTNINHIIAGIACHIRLWNPNAEIEKLDFIRPHSEFIKWASQFAGNHKMRKPSVLGAAFSTWVKNRSAAEIFWPMVNEETGKTPDCPTRVLAKFLQNICIDKTIRWTTHSIYVKCHHAWNAWRDEKTTNLKYHKKYALPEPK